MPIDAETKWKHDISAKLDLVVALLGGIATATEVTISVTARIMRLRSLGLAPAQIGRVLGKSTKYVTAVLSQKKPGKNKPREEKDDSG